MRSGVKAAVVGGVFAVMVGGAGYGAYHVVSAVDGGGGSAAAGAERTGPPSKDEVRETSEKFFAAWERGDADAAADLTDNALGAKELFVAYGGQARIGRVKVTPGAATGTTVPFEVSATVSYEGRSKPLTYRSELAVVRGRTTGRALVDWRPSVLHPDLKAGDTLVTGESASPPIEAVGRDGTVLTEEEYPSLGPVLDALRDRYGDRAGGSPGVELAVRHAGGSTDGGTGEEAGGGTGEQAGATSLVTLAEGRPGRLRTTIDADVQAAAEKAVQRYAQSSVVAVRPSTGEVLAVANHREDAFNAAFQGKAAPGSTMKIVTAAMLIDRGVTSATGPAPCTPDAMWQSGTFHNLKGMRPDEGATLAESFARSCNTAFVKLVDGSDERPLTDESLTTEAREGFGIGKDWKTGIVSFDGSVPASGGSARAANAIGQGDVQMNPLNMASVTATAITGTFRQPYLVSPKLDGRAVATARGLPGGTAAQLKQMMRLTATSGTGAQAMADLGGDIGAKTGSAEVDGQETSNSWFTGFRGDVAAAAMTEKGGHGGDAAGPIVAAVLRTGG